MNKQLTVLTAAVFFCFAITCAFAGCSVPLQGDVCPGDFLYNGTGDLDGVKNITGDLNFNPSLEEITDINDLVNVGSDIFFSGLGSLKTISGFNSVTTIGKNLEIGNNPALTTISGFSSLTTVGGHLPFYDNPALTTFSGFKVVTTVGKDFYIGGSPYLTTVTGFDALTTVGWLGIEDNTELENINFLSSLKEVNGDVEITGNDNITSFCPLGNLESVTGSLTLVSASATCTPTYIPITVNCTCPSPSPSPSPSPNPKGSGGSIFECALFYFMKEIIAKIMY